MSNPEDHHKTSNPNAIETWAEDLVEVTSDDMFKLYKENRNNFEKHLGENSYHNYIRSKSDKVVIDKIIYRSILSKDSENKKTSDYAQSSHRSRDLMMQIVDLILEPDEAEETMGDLEEGYARRHTKNKGHAVRWVWAQTIRIAVNWTFDLIRQYARAKTGK